MKLSVGGDSFMNKWTLKDKTRQLVVCSDSIGTSDAVDSIGSNDTIAFSEKSTSSDRNGLSDVSKKNNFFTCYKALNTYNI